MKKIKTKPVGEVKYSCSGDVSAPRVLWWAFELSIEQEMTIALTMTILPASMVIPITMAIT